MVPLIFDRIMQQGSGYHRFGRAACHHHPRDFHQVAQVGYVWYQ
jgi:hypothetical protein